MPTRSDMLLVKPDNLISKDTNVVFYLSCFIRRVHGEITVKEGRLHGAVGSAFSIYHALLAELMAK